MAEKDVTVKAMLRRECPLFKELIGIRKDTVPLQPRLSRVRDTEVDFLGEREDGSLIHIEFQTKNEPGMLLRMFAYRADIAVVRSQDAARRRKLSFERVEQKVVFIGTGTPRMENTIDHGRGLAYCFDIVDLKSMDGSNLLRSDFITDVIFAISCGGGESPETIRAILERIREEPNSPVAINLSALLILANARGIGEAVIQEMKMPITADARLSLL